jgi:hypothetical protein
MKGTFHKSCSCPMCRYGRGRGWGQFIKNRNERKLRRKAKRALSEVVRGAATDAVVAPISSPYTD